MRSTDVKPPRPMPETNGTSHAERPYPMLTSWVNYTQIKLKKKTQIPARRAEELWRMDVASLSGAHHEHDQPLPREQERVSLISFQHRLSTATSQACRSTSARRTAICAWDCLPRRQDRPPEVGRTNTTPHAQRKCRHQEGRPLTFLVS